jgi:hypothetical protein
MWRRRQRRTQRRIVNGLQKFATQEQLASAGVTDDVTAWELLEGNRSETLKALVEKAGKEKKAFLIAFTNAAIDVTNQYGFSKAELSWFDYARVIAGIAILGLAALLWRGVSGGAEWRVVAATDLPALVPLRSSDVKLERGEAGSDGFRREEDVVSRYPLVATRMGTRLNNKNLSSGPWGVISRDGSLIEIPLKNRFDPGGWKMPIRATLTAIPRPGFNATALSIPVWILMSNSGRDGSRVWVSAIASDKTRLETFEAALGSADVYATVTIPH